jgi:hypothetical protein
MAEIHSPAATRSRSISNLALSLARWAGLAGLAAVLALQLAFFTVHAAHMLRYRYPLDYGEGPLLAQVDLLRAGTPIWHLYADPDRPPYAVVNYPPVYHLVSAAVAGLAGDTLLAGRLVALASALAAVGALWVLSQGPRAKNQEPRTGYSERFLVLGSRFLIVLSFLAIPIVREWAVVMRVDLLGVALGLWALVIVQRCAGRRAVLWAALPLALSLLVKPSLIAAPAAALVWLLFRDWRRAIGLGLLVGLIGGLVTGLLQLASGGWFLLHVLSANANSWDRKLAYGFWHDQLLILWPLVAAAGLGGLLGLSAREPRTKNQEPDQIVLGSRFSVLLPLYYTLFGAIVAYGVGKVGAYTNYFLELYAGLIWLAAFGTKNRGRKTKEIRLSTFDFHFSSFVPVIVVIFVVAAQLRYYPTWSATYLKLAGIIEGQNPPRVIVGGYGVWQDLRRERDILATLAGVNAALDAEVRAAGGPIFTDVPGVAAQSGQLARMPAFEYRQLVDAGLADQRGLLRDLASGRTPLAVLDYLGNWLTPEMITLITHRYAQDGSRGTYDIYRPIDPGPAVAAPHDFAGGPSLVAYHLAASPGGPAYQPGELALLTLDWRAGAIPQDAGDYEVVVRLTDSAGRAVLETARPLLYGALPPRDWGGEVVQHLQPLALPPELPPAEYRLTLALRAGGRDLGPAQPLAPLVVEQPAGRIVGERGYYVPAPLLAEWRRLGADDRTGPGEPIMPAAPLPGGTLQCFTRACLRLVGGAVERVPLGELVHLADVALPMAEASGAMSISPAFQALWDDGGGAAILGDPITPELIRGDKVVQYTRYARLERSAGGGPARLGPLGDEFMRLPGGVPYRWPGAR